VATRVRAALGIAVAAVVLLALPAPGAHAAVGSGSIMLGDSNEEHGVT